MAAYAMVIDLNRCVGCHACVMACKAEWGLPTEESRCWVKPIGPAETPYGLASTFYVGLCNHCDEPSCVEECPTGATYKTKNGSVVVNKELCIGCGNCAVACPYGARYINRLNKKVDKCTFCDERVARGEEPACVKTCPTTARIFGDLEDTKSEVYKKVFSEGAVPIATHKVNLYPNVYYLGKERDIYLLANTYAPQQPIISVPNQMWSLVKFTFLGLFGASMIGTFVAYASQLVMGEKEEDH